MPPAMIPGWCLTSSPNLIAQPGQLLGRLAGEQLAVGPRLVGLGVHLDLGQGVVELEAWRDA